MSNLAPIYEPWAGNAEQMASDIDENAITVRQWRHRGSIPPKYWRKIIAAAANRGAVIGFEAFVPVDPSIDQLHA